MSSAINYHLQAILYFNPSILWNFRIKNIFLPTFYTLIKNFHFFFFLLTVTIANLQKTYNSYIKSINFNFITSIIGLRFIYFTLLFLLIIIMLR